jgi:hypothetical protein
LLYAGLVGEEDRRANGIPTTRRSSRVPGNVELLERL